MPMELLFDLLKEWGPSASTLLAIVFFLKYMSTERQDRQKVHELREAALKTINDDCHSFQERMTDTVTDTLKKVGTSLDNNTRAHERTSVALDRIEGWLDRHECQSRESAGAA